MSADQDLMEKIKTEYGGLLANLVDSSAVPTPPASFLAGLISNESGGNAAAKRFEPRVLSQLWGVSLGHKAKDGSIDNKTLNSFIFDLPIASLVPPVIPNTTFQNLDWLATSWGLTQIMGYHCLEPGAPFARPEDLQDPEKSLRATLWLMGNFCAVFHLDPTKDFSAMLHCWNAGNPDAPTFDPNYVPNALRRMAVYPGLP